VSKKAELDSECVCFDEFPEPRFELAAKLRNCNYNAVLVGGQDRFYSFRNARNREDAAQRLQRFEYWEVSFEENLPC
jgi:hypothetical protein